jgi:TolB-like protein/DNA-binding winged helix-turn-helix (wHTH) protein/Flp pilus assembly protein TadD
VDSEAAQVIDLARADAFVLGPLKVTPSILEVASGDKRETLEPRIMQVFVALARRRGEVVSRDELIRDCWDGRAVGDDAINRCIARLRRLAEAEGGFAIETIPRVGYRLSETESKTESPVEASTKSTWRTLSWQRSAFLGVALLLIISIAALSTGLFKQEAPPDLNRVAVLPFEALSGRDITPFADALTEQIISVLNDNQVQAVSRAQTATLRGPERDRSARSLGADFILDGTIARTAKGLRITVHLDHASTHATLWSESFDQDGADPVGLQSQVAARVVDEIKAALKAAITHDDAAISAYLKAQENAREGGATATALRHDQMRIVVARAPNFSLGYSGLGLSAAQLLRFTNGPQVSTLRAEASEAIAQALKLAPNNGEAYVARAMLAADSDIAEQESQLRKGLALQPDEPTLNSTLSAVLDDVGRVSEALKLQQRAVMLDPLSPRKTAGLAFLYAVSGQTAEARDTINRAAKLWPQSQNIWSTRLYIYGGFGYERQAIELLRSAPAPLEPDFIAALRAYFTAMDEKTETSRSAAEKTLVAALRAHHFSKPFSAVLLANLGDIDAAFTQAEEAYFSSKLSGTQLRPDTAMLFHPNSAALRRDPRFVSLVTRLGLMDYWKSHPAPDFCLSEDVEVCHLLRAGANPKTRSR